MRFQLVLIIHAHQPVGNFDSVMESSHQSAYLPFLNVLEHHPGVHIGLHYSGPLLEWLEKAHPEYLETLRTLCARGQVEMLGGGFYEPILIAIPLEDRREQIRRLADYVERHFGARPKGAWLAERVWEPGLPSTLAASGVEYTLVDDNHFLCSGFESSQLCGDYLAEDQGASVRLLPGWKALRYLIPYRSPEENLDYFRNLSAQSPGGMVTMGDDLEKFGVWPGTFKHCYEEGWLDLFFSALESVSDWLETATPSAALAARHPLGRADLPTASYAEMSEWSLPTPARLRYEALTKEFASRPEAQHFLRGGIWRNFFSKYSESNLLHKKMLHASERLRSLESRYRRSHGKRERLEHARRLILSAQCNDPYWHGVFGGLYAPHLRTALWRPLVEADAEMGRLEHGRKVYSESKKMDFDADGNEEICLASNRYAAVIAPGDGGTIKALDFRPCSAALINSLMRRPEAYHQRLRSAQQGSVEGAVSIHEQTRAKEPGLADRLRYDRWQRHGFRLLVFDVARTFDDYQRISLQEDAVLAGGEFTADSFENDSTKLGFPENGYWKGTKEFHFAPCERGFEIACSVTMASLSGGGMPAVGLEMIFNLLAADAPDRFFETPQGKRPMSFSGVVEGCSLRLADNWQRFRISLHAEGAREIWIAPIETISESEDGFERVYQGSQILAVWRPDFSGSEPWTAEVTCRVERLSSHPS